MSYRFNSAYGIKGHPVLVTTKKAPFKAVCFPEKRNSEVNEYLESIREDHRIYAAHHCDSDSVFTHIGEITRFIVNHFGYVVTDTDLWKYSDTPNHLSVDIGSGWFKRIYLTDLSRVKEYI